MKSPFPALFLSVACFFSAVPLPASGTDPEYIKEYHENLIPSFFISESALKMKVYESGKSNPRSVEYLPNTKETAGLGFSWRSFGFSGYWAGANTKFPKSSHGKTKYNDYQFNFYFRSFGIDAVYQKYRGFYLNTAPVSVKPDLEAVQYGVNVFYVFSHERFSFRAPFRQTERQKKSAGSFLVMSAVSRIRVETDSPLVPAPLGSYFGDMADLRTGSFYTFSFLPGYAHTLTSGAFYVTPALFLGPGYQWKDFAFSSGGRSSSGLTMKANVRLSLGYNGDKFFSGLAGFSDITAVKRDNTSVDFSAANIYLFVGGKF